MSPTEIGPVRLRNRIVFSAHGTKMSTRGVPDERLVAYHEARARGGVGLIICEAASVHETAGGSSSYAVAYTDDCIPGYRRIAGAVHRHGTKIFGQLYHPGRGDIAGGSDDGTIFPIYAPSAIACESKQLTPRAMPVGLVREIVRSYGEAARRMAEAGLDGVEVMAHHSHLVSQFLNPRSNRRNDAYGGSFENRMRFLVEILHEVRAEIGDGFALGVRISGDEQATFGLRPDETNAIAQAVDRLGLVDYFSVNSGSCSAFDGSIHVVPPMAIEAGYVGKYSAAIKKVVTKPVIATGRINTPDLAEGIIASAKADLCGIVRGLICDPDLPSKAAADTPQTIRLCIGCNQACIGHSPKGAPISCIQYPESGRELQFGDLPPAARRCRVLVAGGGPAGLKAAAVAASRGHDVTLLEKRNELGGQAMLAAALPGREEFGGIVSNLVGEAERAGARLVPGVTVTRELVDREAPDVVIVATGVRRRTPDLGQNEVDAWRLFQILHDHAGEHRRRKLFWELGQANVGAEVVVVDSRLDWLAMGLAEQLALGGCKVRLAVLGYMPGQNIPKQVRDHWAGVLHRLGVEVLPYMRYLGAEGDTARFAHMTGGREVLVRPVDTVIHVAPPVPETELEESLSGYTGIVHIVGDCLAPRTAEEAVLDGLKAGATAELGPVRGLHLLDRAVVTPQARIAMHTTTPLQASKL
ncbi:FAD-dependent oxidoreductase [Chelativorans xinjiangense]|uniref:oxidoreductase n=1 Tax=Chelativorans xinjiangense TaxID=2681485 RepID=UPI001FE58195|nr:FAD-dependent oxidoreductase [Chelativorans xinjiangense]